MKKVLILEDNLQALKVLEKIAGEAAPDVLPLPASNVASAYHMAMEQDISLSSSGYGCRHAAGDLPVMWQR